MKFSELERGFRGWVRVEGRVLLVGDVNQLGGVCDDCVGVAKDDEVEVLAHEAPPSTREEPLHGGEMEAVPAEDYQRFKQAYSESLSKNTEPLPDGEEEESQ